MIALGSKVEDKVSGCVGIVTAKIEYLNGCIQYTVCPKMKTGATELVQWNIDEEQLKVFGKPIKVKKKDTGGATTKASQQY